MDWKLIAENWSELRLRAGLKWERLTIEDLTRIAGQRNDFIGRVHMRYGLTRLDAEEQVERWASGLRSPPLGLSIASTTADEPRGLRAAEGPSIARPGARAMTVANHVCNVPETGGELEGGTRS
jgi:hypothetical protein